MKVEQLFVKWQKTDFIHCGILFVYLFIISILAYPEQGYRGAAPTQILKFTLIFINLW